MGLREQVIGILKNGFTQRIGFSFTGSTGAKITVAANDLLSVAQAIEGNKIAVQSSADVGSGWAKYTARDDGDSKANTLYVGANDYTSRIFEGLIVHEAIHAVFDLKKTVIPWLDNEATAYIAQGFYLKNANFSADKLSIAQQPFLGRMIADSVDASGNFDAFWLEELQNSLLSDPMYHGYIRGTFTGDG